MVVLADSFLGASCYLERRRISGKKDELDEDKWEGGWWEGEDGKGGGAGITFVIL